MEHKTFPNNSSISAKTIILGKDFSIGANVRINVRGLFTIGDFSRFGNNVEIVGNNVVIGKHFFHYTPGLNIGGGGSQFEFSNFLVGDRCVLHNNYINLACPVTLGDDVGLSPDVQILTHGFWQSVLEGYPHNYGPVTIGNGVIIGQRSVILPDCCIANNVVVGANSTVSKSLLESKSVYAGSPAKLIRKIVPPSRDTQIEIARKLIETYKLLAAPKRLWYKFPLLKLNNTSFNLEKQTITGPEDEDTDKLRDFLRRFGIRIYSSRPFLSL